MYVANKEIWDRKANKTNIDKSIKQHMNLKTTRKQKERFIAADNICYG